MPAQGFWGLKRDARNVEYSSLRAWIGYWCTRYRRVSLQAYQQDKGSQQNLDRLLFCPPASMGPDGNVANEDARGYCWWNLPRETVQDLSWDSVWEPILAMTASWALA